MGTIILKGTDLLGCAQTGTGKTAAFAIPILQLLSAKKEQEKGVELLILNYDPITGKKLNIQDGVSATETEI